MQAVILVGGEGTRLRPLTCERPKPMVPIANAPFLEHMLSWMRGYGVDAAVLALCYLPGRIRDHFGDGAALGIRLGYAVEETPLGTAGAVKNSLPHPEETFLVFNGDVLTDWDLGAMIEFHRARGAQATIALTPVDNPTLYGVVEADGEGRVHRFVEKPSWDAVTSNFINAGIYILEPEVLDLVPANRFYMFEHGLFPEMLRLGRPVYGYPSAAYWIDIGTPEKYLDVHRDLLKGKITVPIPGSQVAPHIWQGEGCEIDAAARISGPVVLGQGCRVAAGARLLGPVVLGDGCVVGPDSVVEDAVLWEGTTVGHGATLRGCIVGDHAEIGDGVMALQGVVIGDHAVVGPQNRLEKGLRLWSRRHLEAGAISF